MSIDLEALKVFCRVAELQSFTKAAQQLGMPRARASAQVQKLEALLGTQLLQRSTRVVRLTPEGEQLLKRAPAFLAEAEEISALFHTGRVLRGRVAGRAARLHRGGGRDSPLAGAPRAPPAAGGRHRRE